MDYASKPWKGREGSGSWTNLPDLRQLKAKREIYRIGTAISWNLIFYAAAAALVLATVAMLTVR